MRVPAVFAEEDRQYLPFVAAAVLFATLMGFPLGLTLAHAAAQNSALSGRYPALVQLHGHLQLVAWMGLFVTGMGYRLVSRFTAVKVSPPELVPITFALIVSGLLLRWAQPWAERDLLAVLFAASALLEAGGAAVFTYVILRALNLGRRDEFAYTPFFAAGAVWLLVAMLLNLAFVTDIVQSRVTTIDSSRSTAITFVLLYGFASMFVFAVSIRTFPTFFGRRHANPRLALLAWALANAGIAAYAAATIWRSYETPDASRVLQTAGFLSAGCGFLLMIFVLRVFQGEPHRLRVAAQRSMRVVRSAYAWLLVSAGLQVFFGIRALWDARPVYYFELDAVRHFLAIGFITLIIVGMALLVLPRLAIRRMDGKAAAIMGPLLLALLHGAAAGRGAGSLLANETRITTGYWTMTAGGTLGVLAMLMFAVYLLRKPPEIEIPVAVRTPSSEDAQRGG